MSKKTRRAAKARRALLTLSLVLVVAFAAVGGTLAWLTASSDTVTNTFNTSTIGVTIEETKGTEVTENNFEFQMVPGHTIEKDPKVTVTTGSEEAWLFVQITESANFRDYMTYAVADGWTFVEGTEYVYGRIVRAADIGEYYYVLKDNQVTVKEGVTTADMTAATDNEPTLTFTAYVCQLYKTNGTEFTIDEAWAIAPTTGSVSTN